MPSQLGAVSKDKLEYSLRHFGVDAPSSSYQSLPRCRHVRARQRQTLPPQPIKDSIGKKGQ